MKKQPSCWNGKKWKNAAFEKPAGVSGKRFLKQRTYWLITRGQLVRALHHRQRSYPKRNFIPSCKNILNLPQAEHIHPVRRREPRLYFRAGEKAVISDSTLSFFNRTDKAQRRSDAAAKPTEPGERLYSSYIMEKPNSDHTKKGGADRFGNHAAPPRAGNIS